MTEERLRSAGFAALKLFALLAGYLLVLLAVSLAWVVLAGIDRYPASLDAAMRTLQIVSGGIFLAIVVRFYRKKRLSFARDAGLHGPGLGLAAYALFACYGVVLNLMFVIVLNLLPSAATASYSVSVAEAFSLSGLLLNCLTVLVYAPVSEEILFRGLCLTYLRECLNPYWSAALLSVVFGLAHAQPLWAVYTMLMGMVFSAATIRTGSIRPSIVSHCAFNATSFVLYVTALRFEADWPFGMSGFTVWLLLAAVAALAAKLTITLYRLTGRCSANGGNHT